MSDPIVRVDRTGTLARVTMNRPDVRNAFNAALIAALRDTFVALGGDAAVRTIVLAGAGTSFSGGADITWMRDALDLTEADNVRDAGEMAAMLRAIDACPKPVIARIQGAALGGGSGLAAVADIVVAADNAVFGFTEVKLGILPAVISPFVLAKIGRSHARRLFLTGERFGADHARTIGLVHEVVPADALDARVDAIVAELRTASATAIAVTKTVIAAVAEAASTDADAITTRAIARQRTSSEGQEGLRAFLERRSAAWHDR